MILQASTQFLNTNSIYHIATCFPNVCYIDKSHLWHQDFIRRGATKPYVLFRGEVHSKRVEHAGKSLYTP